MTAASPFRATYDRNADVLYLVARREAAVKGIEDGRGIVWRYDMTGTLIGVTIMDYKELWIGREQQLANELAPRFRVSTQDVKRALPN